MAQVYANSLPHATLKIIITIHYECHLGIIVVILLGFPNISSYQKVLHHIYIPVDLISKHHRVGRKRPPQLKIGMNREPLNVKELVITD